jgi:alanyl aminopeptidase
VEPRPGESPAEAVARPDVWHALVFAGGDTSAHARFREWTDARLAGRPGAPATLEALALAATARDGGAERFAQLLAAFRAEREPAQRRRWLAALGAVRDTALVARGLELAASPGLSAQEIGDLVDAIGDDESRRDACFAWVRRSYAWLASRLPAYEMARLPEFAGGCSRERLAEARAFFSDPARAPVGTAESLARTAARVEACAALREREGPAVREALVSP